MRIANLIDKWKQFVNRMNDKGIPIPFIRDPQSLEGSVSLTLVVISTSLVVFGIISKWSGWLGGIDMNSAFNFFYASTTLYFGHNWLHKDAVEAKSEPVSPKVAPKAAPTPKADDPDA
jgi:hypothetical protein